MVTYRAYFAGVGSDGGYQLWVTNGTAQGTNELPVANGTGASLYPTGLTNFGASILFGGIDRSGFFNLYVSDGTAAGTTELTATGASRSGLFAYQVENMHGLTDTVFAVPQPFTVVGGTAIFLGVDANNHLQLWRTDGTSAGTQQVIVTGAASDGLHPTDITTFGNKALFAGNDGSGRNALWVSDGTAAGTTEILSAGAAPNGLTPAYITQIGGKAVFSGSDANGSSGLWVTDGTASGTKEIAVAGARGGPYGLFPHFITAFGNLAIFTGTDSSGRDELWTTDGTSAGTHEIIPAAALGTGLFSQFLYTSFTPFGGKMLFNGYAADGSDQMWITDGTIAGTTQLTNSAEGQYSDSGSPGMSETAVLGAKAVFGNYYDAAGRWQLWVTDGTAAGTVELQPAGANPYSLLPQNLTSIGGQAVFSGVNAQQQTQLWVTDGTNAGTAQVPASGVLEPQGFVTKASRQTDVYGNATGHGTINGTAGDDFIHAYGLGNTIYTNGGSDMVNAGAGGATVYAALGAPAGPFAAPLDGGEGLNETINIGGTGNAIYGGSENFTIVGGTGGNSVTVGFGNHVISLFGANNQVTLGSGVSSLRFTGGSAFVFLTDFGDTPPPELYNVSLQFTGTGNTLVNTAGAFSHAGLQGDRGTLKVTGGTGGGDFDVSWSNATLVTGGTGNTVHAGQGVSNISPGSGSDTVLLETSVFFNQVGGDVTVKLAGQHNTVRGEARTLNLTGGGGYGTFTLVGGSHYSYVGFAGILSRNYTISTAGVYNVFTLEGGNSNTIDTGYGNATVTIANPVTYGVAVPLVSSSIAFGGTHNNLVGGDAPITVTGGIGYGDIALGDGNDSVVTRGPSNTIVVGDGNDTIVAGTSLASVTAGNGTDAITIAGSHNTVVAGNGDDTVSGNAAASHVSLGDGSDTFLLTGGGNVLTAGNGADNFTLAGYGNVVVAGDGDDTVTGGAGASSVTLGHGMDTVQLGGWGNSISLGGGFGMVDGGLGFTTVNLSGGFTLLDLHGRGDVVTLNSGSFAQITDTSSDLLLKLTSDNAQAMIVGFGASTGARLDLIGGVGGFAHPQDVIAALQDDGYGGTLLPLNGGAVDFLDVAPTALHAANFIFQSA